MRAIVATRSGSPDVLELREVDKPVPQDGEVLVRIRAATVTTGDVILRKLPRLMYVLMRLFGTKRKEIPGHEFAGDIEAVGSGVSRFRAGDAVFGTTTGLRVGANAEYVCVPADGALAIKPASVSYEQAAAIPVGAMTALYFLRQGNVRSGQRVLIYGASGSVGTYAVQLAHHLGAQVTGVASGRHAELVKSLGAARFIDYTKGDFCAGDERYDLIFDAVGKASASDCEAALAPEGAFVTVSQGTANESADDLAYLGGLVEAEEVRAVIDRCYALAQAAEAHRYVEKGHKVGNVVLRVQDDAGN